MSAWAIGWRSVCGSIRTWGREAASLPPSASVCQASLRFGLLTILASCCLSCRHHEERRGRRMWSSWEGCRAGDSNAACRCGRRRPQAWNGSPACSLARESWDRSQLSAAWAGRCHIHRPARPGSWDERESWLCRPPAPHLPPPPARSPPLRPAGRDCGSVHPPQVLLDQQADHCQGPRRRAAQHRPPG
jgi:hypothetical protein